MPEPEGIAKALREPLLKKFPAALLGRLVVIPYYPLSDAMLANIVRLQLGRIAKRVSEHHKIPFTYDDEAVKLIVSRCTEVESGGRMIDAILTNTVLPAISREFLTRTMAGLPLERRAAGRGRAATSTTGSTERRADAASRDDTPTAARDAISVGRGDGASPSSCQKNGQLADAEALYRTHPRGRARPSRRAALRRACSRTSRDAATRRLR